MSPHRLTLAVLASAALLAPAAHADTVVVADPTALNVSAYGDTSAWSRQADDGTYRLVVDVNGAIADAPVAASPVPFDPDLGPARGGGHLAAVYSRCAGSSATAHCDVEVYDLATQTETRAPAAVSAASTSETAPSIFNGNISFARAGGARPGWYLYRAGGHTATRLSTKRPVETDLNATEAVELYQPGAPSGGESYVRQSNLNGSRQRTIAHATINGAGEGARLFSPTLSRFNVFWLRVDELDELTTVQRTGVNAHRGLAVLTAGRTLPGVIESLATTSVPTAYAAPAGLTKVDPPLAFS